MLPSQRKKVDMSTMTDEEKKLFRLYGKLPTHKNVLTKITKDRKYFDSGDYALSKAGVAPQANVGTAIPSPDNIPHATPSPQTHPPTTQSHPPTSGTPNGAPLTPMIIPVIGNTVGQPAGSPPHISSPIRESITASE